MEADVQPSSPSPGRPPSPQASCSPSWWPGGAARIHGGPGHARARRPLRHVRRAAGYAAFSVPSCHRRAARCAPPLGLPVVETAVYLALTLALAGFSFWRINRNRSTAPNIRRPAIQAERPRVDGGRHGHSAPAPDWQAARFGKCSRGSLAGMTIGAGLVLLATVAVICVLLSLLRPRRPRLANRGRRPRGYRWRRMEAIKAAAAADIALIRGDEDRVPRRDERRTRTR